MLQIKQASPNVDMTKATIKDLLDTDSKMSQYQVNQSTALGKYLGQGGDPYQFEGWYAKNFPLSPHTIKPQGNAVKDAVQSSPRRIRFEDMP